MYIKSPLSIRSFVVRCTIIMLAFCLFECGSKKTDPTPKPAASPFVGTWTISKIVDTNTGADVTADPARACQAGAVSVFAADNSFTSTDSACSLYGFSGTWSIDNSTTILTVKTSAGALAWQGKTVFTSDKTSFTVDQTDATGYIYTFKKK